MWHTGPYRSSTRTYKLEMQLDGDLVLYDDSKGRLWSTQTKSKRGGHYLVLENNGRLVMYVKEGSVKWKANC